MKSSLLLRQGADELGIALTHEMCRTLLELADHVLFWRSVAGLTSYTVLQDVLIYMVLDSLAAVPLLTSSSSQRVLDLGTGAGFPGLPLKIVMPSLDVTLMDSSTRKAEFLTRLACIMRLSEVSVCCCRADDIRSAESSYFFDVIVSRACASLGELCLLSLPYLKPGGRILAWKGPQLEKELEDARFILSDNNLSYEGSFPYTLPFAARSCTIAAVRKI
ncbi:MAG: 16S rRNA (guanine(527)-N(7))-methyltransferase RsmG [Candidatus Xenobiia bacterium LiM19]